MAIVLQNALLAHLDPIGVERGGLRIDEGRIVDHGETPRHGPSDEVIDCGGAVVLPGLVNGHTHLYSALAVGMPAPPQTPRNFLEILKFVWWRLDRALDEESIEMSARIGALDALRCGTTTLIDHHASPECIAGSLDRIERGIDEVGPRALLCYETTDRNGRAGRQAGLAENRRYLEKCDKRRDGRFAALAGGHASFTLEDETMQALAELAVEFHCGVHIHVAEDPCDEQACRRDHGLALIDRLAKRGLMRPDSIFAHGAHLDREAIGEVNRAGLSLAHNPRSNMNNAVGYAPVGEFACPILLGTDGIGADMFTEAKIAWFKSRDGGSGLTPNDILSMLAASARRASASLGVTIGKIEVGAEADLVMTDYRPATPFTSGNLAGHFIFAMGARHVRDVLIGGRWAMRRGKIQTTDEDAVRSEAIEVGRRLWERMERID